MKKPYKLVSSQLKFDGQVFKVHVDEIALENKGCFQRELVEHGGGVMIAMCQDDGRYLLVNQYRYGIGEYQLEFTAGRGEAGEDSRQTALREGREETGYQPVNVRRLGSVVPTGAYDSEVIELYWGQTGAYVGQSLDEDEQLEIVRMSLDEIIEAIKKGTIRDGKTVAAALLIKEGK